MHDRHDNITVIVMRSCHQKNERMAHGLIAHTICIEHNAMIPMKLSHYFNSFAMAVGVGVCWR